MESTGHRKPYRVLLGTDYSWSGIEALPRLLAAAGCETTLVAPSNTKVALTYFAERKIACAPDRSSFLRAFCDALAERAYDMVILANECFYELAGSCDPSLLRGWFPVPLEWDRARAILSKNGFLQHARAHGIAVPEFAICSSLPVAQAAAEALGYPVFVKEPRGHAGTTTHRAENAVELAGVYAALPERDEIVVQRAVRGLVGSTDVLFDRGRPLCWLSSYDSASVHEASSRTVRRIIERSALDAIVDRVGAITGFHGFAGIDWVHDAETGAFVVLELNPSPQGGYALTSDAERAFTKAVRAMLARDRFYGPYAVPGRSEPIPVFPDFGVYFAESSGWRSPTEWLRLARMLTRVPLLREPRIAVEQLKDALCFVFELKGFRRMWFGGKRLVERYQERSRAAARRTRSATAAPMPDSTGVTTTITSEPASSASRSSV